MHKKKNLAIINNEIVEFFKNKNYIIFTIPNSSPITYAYCSYKTEIEIKMLKKCENTFF